MSSSKKQHLSNEDLEDLLADYCSEDDSLSDSEYSYNDSDSENGDNIDVNILCGEHNKTFTWEDMINYIGQKETFCNIQGQQNEAKNQTDSVKVFKMFFSQDLIEMIAAETNRYAEQHMKNRGMLFPFRSRVRSWEPVSTDEIYTVIALFMLMGIIQKPTLRSYFSCNGTISTPIFLSVISVDRFETICRFLHFVNNETEASFQGPAQLFKIYPVVTHLNERFKKLYLPEQNIAIDESLTLWKGHLSFKQYLPLKSARFGIKTYELCESASGYLWSFIIYTGKSTVLDSPLITEDINKTSAIVLQLVEPLLNKGYTLWMDNYYNSPSLAQTLKFWKTDCVGTLRLNRKEVPKKVKDAKLQKGQHIAQHSGPITVIKWKDKKDVTMISTYHNDTMEKVMTKKCGEKEKPTCVLEYNQNMGGVDLKDQYLQMYQIERKRTKKWNIKMFKRLLNASILNTMVICKKNLPEARMDTLKFRIELVEKLLIAHGQKEKKVPGRHSSDSTVERLTGRHFVERIPPTGKKAQPQKRCVVCYKNGRRKEPVYWCPDCKVGLCVEGCFKDFHTKLNY